MTTAVERRVRLWLGACAILAQVAATGAGLLRPFALVVLAVAAAATAPAVIRTSARVRSVGYVLAAVVAVIAASQLVGSPDLTSADVSRSLSLLTLTLAALTIVLAPGWRRPRDYRMWLAMSATIAVAACATGSGQAEAGLLVATWLAILVAAVVLQSWSLGAVGDVTVAASPAPSVAGKRFGIAVQIAVPVALGALLFAALPGGLGGGALPARLARYLHPSSPSTLTRGVAGIDTDGSGDLDLRVRGALPTTPLILTPLGAPPLWRGTIYRDYTGSDWEAPVVGVGPEHGLVRGNDVTLPPTQDDAFPAGVARTDVVRREPAMWSTLAWAPGVIRRVRANMFAAIRDRGAVRLFGSRDAHSYTVTSVVAETAPAVLSRVAGPDIADNSWTALPSELPRRVVDLAQRVAGGASSRYAQVQAIQLYLRAHETYSLDSPVPAANQDAVDRFLFHDHVGFCEQFASAEAVMLRAIGVPARVVSGLAYGHRQHDGVLFTAADAHAWVEVYYPGVGWSPTDPTLDVRLATATGHQHGVLAFLRRALNGSPAGLAILLAFVLSGCAGVVLVRRRRSRRNASAAQPVLSAFLHLVRRSRRPRHPAETAREYLSRQHAVEPLDDALLALEAECYGAQAPEPDQVAHAVRLLTRAKSPGRSSAEV